MFYHRNLYLKTKSKKVREFIELIEKKSSQKLSLESASVRRIHKKEKMRILLFNLVEISSCSDVKSFCSHLGREIFSEVFLSIGVFIEVSAVEKYFNLRNVNKNGLKRWLKLKTRKCCEIKERENFGVVKKIDFMAEIFSHLWGFSRMEMQNKHTAVWKCRLLCNRNQKPV